MEGRADTEVITQNGIDSSDHALCLKNKDKTLNSSPKKNGISDEPVVNGCISVSSLPTKSDADNTPDGELSCEVSNGSLSVSADELQQDASLPKRKKKVNIKTDVGKDDETELEAVTETTALRRDPEAGSSDKMLAPDDALQDGYLTMTGTIKRGKKAGQNIDVKLNISREELEVLEASIQRTKVSDTRECIWGLSKGLHVFLWTVVCLPVVFVASSFYSFYMGTITWYNIFTFYSEEKSLAHKIFMSPLLILSYPFFIITLAIGLGLYSSMTQISWYFHNWYKDVTDLEKGFYGWMCSILKLEECSPYTVVILTDIQQENKEETQQCTQGNADTAYGAV